MAALLGESSIKRLSDAEVAILLLSAYCHDVGMTPNRSLSRSIYQYVLTGENNLVPDAVATDIKQWLDRYRPGVELPVSANRLSSDSIKLAEEICAYYGRSKHNDWSEDWIRSEFSNQESPALYNGWIDDLVTTCRSHHDGLTELRSSRFDAKIVGTPPQNMNLRYLAAVLRLADVMEFDPERTPDVVIRSRDIAPSSRIYWYKDKEISFQLDKERHQIIFTARTANAETHNAVLMTAKWVDDELLICSALAQENAFKRGTVLPSTRENYDWPWPARLTTDIKEASDHFVYIDGAFRPEPKRILELLSGTALYGHPIVAVRELLQNAIDAVREQIAFQRLASATPESDAVAGALSNLHSVKLRLYSEGGRYWLQCEDSGVGLSKETIERGLLVGGSGPRPESRSLERAAQAAGFEVGRTGKFGIGVLSYFMIGDRLEITSRRSQLAGDPDGTGWHFSIDGLSDFGELTKASRTAPGTDVRLRLRGDLLGKSPEQWLDRLTAYLSRVLVWTPCQVTMSDEVFGRAARTWGPGWTSSPNEAADHLLSEIEPPEVDESQLYTTEWRRQFEEKTAKISELKGSILGSLRSLPPTEVALPDGQGIARLWLPYFEMDGANALGFLDLQSRSTKGYEQRKDLLLPKYVAAQAWRGFSVDSEGPRAPCCLEINYTNNMSVSVSRMHLDRGDNSERIDEFLRSQSIDMISTFVRSNFNTRFSSLNQAILYRFGRILHRLDQDIYWKIHSAKSGTEWSMLDFPVCSPLRNSFMEDFEKNLLRSEVSSYTFAEAIYSPAFRRIALAGWIGGGRLLVEGNPNGYGGTACIAWDSKDQLCPLDGRIKSLTAEFPPDWEDVIAVVTDQRSILNKAHGAIGILPDESVYRSTSNERVALELAVQRSRGQQREIIEFVVGATSRGPEFWRLIRQHYKDFYQEIFDVFRRLGHDRIIIWSAKGYGEGNVVTALTAKEVATSTGYNSSSKNLIPAISDDVWILKK